MRMGKIKLRMLSLTLLAASLSVMSCGSKPGARGVAPEKVAELIHQVIEADRTVYTRKSSTGCSSTSR